MHRTITTLAITTVLTGLAPAVFAQSAPVANSASSLQGLQARSIQPQPVQPQLETPNVPSTNSPLANVDPTKPQILVSRPNDRTQIILSPVTTNGPQELGTNSAEGAGLTGNNKVQLLYELDQ